MSILNYIIMYLSINSLMGICTIVFPVDRGLYLEYLSVPTQGVGHMLGEYGDKGISSVNFYHHIYQK